MGKKVTVNQAIKIAILFICIPLLLLILNMIVGIYYSEDLTFLGFFTDPIFSNTGVTFSEMLFDTNRFFGEFLKSIVFAVGVAGIFVVFGRSQDEIRKQTEHVDTRRKTLVFGILSLVIIVTMGLLSVFNLGLQQSHLEGWTSLLAMQNYYPEFFAHSLLAYLFVAIFTPLPYLFLKRRLNLDAGKAQWKPLKAGIGYLIIYLVIIQVIFFASPLKSFMFHSPYIPHDIVYSLLDILLITGIILLIEIKQLPEEVRQYLEEQAQKQVEDKTEDEVIEKKAEGTATKTAESAEEQDIDADSKKTKAKPSKQEKKAVEPLQEPKTLIEKIYKGCLIAFLIAFFGISFYLMDNGVFFTFPAYLVLNRVMILFFRIYLVLFFYHLAHLGVFEKHLGGFINE